MAATCKLKNKHFCSDIFKDICSSDLLSKDLVERIRKLQNAGNEISVNDIKTIYYDYFKHSDHSFHEFLEHFEIILPKPYFPPRNPELEARIHKLKNQQAALEYNHMTKNVRIGETKSQIAELRSEAKVVKTQLISVLNFVMSVVGTFAFVYKAIEYSSYIPNIAEQVLGGIIAATVVALAELYFLAVNDLSC